MGFRAGPELLFEIVDARAALKEAFVGEEFAMKLCVGLDALDGKFGERDAHARDRLLAGIAVGDDLPIMLS